MNRNEFNEISNTTTVIKAFTVVKFKAGFNGFYHFSLHLKLQLVNLTILLLYIGYVKLSTVFI